MPTFLSVDCCSSLFFSFSTAIAILAALVGTYGAVRFFRQQAAETAAMDDLAPTHSAAPPLSANTA